MANLLNVSIGQFSHQGRKEVNQDFHGIDIPKEPLLSSKGIAIAIADGISSSDVSQIASESAVTSFLEDYACTSEAWSVKKSVRQVLMATNSWLYAQTQKSQHRYNKDKGYVCTLSAMVIKSTTAHIFHVGDSRIYQLRGKSLEQLTNDHRHWVSQDQSYLSRALGNSQQLEIDYQALQVEKGDTFLLATDGVYEFSEHQFIINIINEHINNLDAAAKIIVDEAYKNGSTDNLTAQVVCINELPNRNSDEIYQQLTELPFPPTLTARATFDGYRIIREVHASSRSNVYLAVDIESNEKVIIKTPAIDLKNDTAHLERFLMEEWIAKRINSPYVLKPCLQSRKRNYIYIVTEFIEGHTLTQWLRDNPKPALETVRGIVDQIAKGLLAFHKLEMLHQDLRPENIMIDNTGTVKIIDFGSTRVAGIMERTAAAERDNLLGTAQYTAPEYFIGGDGSPRSDIFSLGVVTYQLLTGKLPYGTEVTKCKTKTAQNNLRYDEIQNDHRKIPVWVDEAIKKAVAPDPYKRYEALSEFLFDLRRPNKSFQNRTRLPLIERNPATFWKIIAFILTIIIIALLAL